MEGVDLVEEIPGAQIACLGQPHQIVDGEVHPEGEQAARQFQVVVAARDEHDRSVSVLGRDPIADREGWRAAWNRVWHEPEGLTVDVQDRPDRLCHARRLLGRQRPGDGVFQLGVYRLQVCLHQMVSDGCVIGLAELLELDAHFDEEHPRGVLPEGLLVVRMGGNEGGCGRDEVGIIPALIEQRPRCATCVHRVQNDVGLGVVERLHEGAGEVEDDRAMTSPAKLIDQRPKLGRLAGAGRADHHGVALFEAPWIGDASD